jgi:hypothetical protein
MELGEASDNIRVSQAEYFFIMEQHSAVIYRNKLIKKYGIKTGRGNRHYQANMKQYNLTFHLNLGLTIGLRIDTKKLRIFMNKIVWDPPTWIGFIFAGNTRCFFGEFQIL